MYNNSVHDWKLFNNQIREVVMLKWLMRLMKAYDALIGSNKLLVFMAIALPGIILAGLGNNVVKIIGLIYLLALAILRLYYLEENNF